MERDSPLLARSRSHPNDTFFVSDKSRQDETEGCFSVCSLNHDYGKCLFINGPRFCPKRVQIRMKEMTGCVITGWQHDMRNNESTEE